MRAIDTLRRAGRSLSQARTRTLLTSLAIGVGAFTIMLSLAANEGARRYADELVSSNVNPDSLFIVKDKAVVGGTQPQSGLREYDPDVGSQQGITVKQLNKKDITTLKKRSDISDVRPLYNVDATYLTIEGFAKKYTSELDVYNPDILSEKVAGTLPSLGDDIAPGKVVVPNSVAEKLKLTPQQLVGKTISFVIERPAKVPSDAEIQRIVSTKGPDGLKQLATTEKKTVTLQIAAVVKPPKLSFTPSSAMLLPISAAENIANFSTKGTKNYQKYFAASAKVTGDNTPADVKQALQNDGFYPQTADDLQGFLFTIVNVITGIVAGFGLIALLASVFGIINTQYISVLERTSQIGLMKALGMRGRDVSRMFRYEAAWIGFLGGVIGVAAAWVVGTLANPWITEQLDLGEGKNLLVFLPLPAILLVAGLIVIAVLAGYFPSRKAAKLDPIEALRTE